MDLMQAINTRRSVRSYSDSAVGEELIDLLLKAAVQAPSASNSQPWSFGVIQDSGLLKQYSDRAKNHLLDLSDSEPNLAKYRDMFTNPGFNIFYNANTLLVIYAKPIGLHNQGDCCLAAQNLMLAAHAQGLGTCWIGFARAFLDLPELKQELGVPVEYTVVAPIIVGYPKGRIPQLSKKDPAVIFRR
jgi:nitroreductase